MDNRPKARAWILTLNNPKHGFDDLNGIVDWDYIVAGNEIAKSGTPHLQCYVYFKDRKLLSTVKKYVPRGHWRIARGTPEHNWAYCTKDGDYFEVGQLPDTRGGASGGRKRAENFRLNINFAKQGRMDLVEENDPISYVTHYHAYKRIQQDNPVIPPNLRKPCGEWIWGPPGVGKSYAARMENPSLYDKPANKWFDGYRGEDTVLIDDFDLVHAVLGHHLKRWGDRYAFPAEMKGTTVTLRPKKIVITSNYSIDEVFTEPSLNAAIKRRFKQRHFIQPSFFNDAPSDDLDLL